MIFATVLAGILIIVGSVFALAAAVGLVRFPDVYSRMHAASKAGTMGSGLMMIALALIADDVATATRAAAGVVFFILTAPVAAHLVAKAAYAVGYRMWEGSVVDEMADGEGR
ncbi:MAG: UPF0091 protein R00998 [Alphaproteobacteria bacterium]|nr:MAG: UPF0091 protein R00998 [Alphaproteobacteria bacterium]